MTLVVSSYVLANAFQNLAVLSGLYSAMTTLMDLTESPPEPDEPLVETRRQTDGSDAGEGQGGASPNGLSHGDRTFSE